jgi:hypothetical protein
MVDAAAQPVGTQGGGGGGGKALQDCGSSAAKAPGKIGAAKTPRDSAAMARPIRPALQSFPRFVFAVIARLISSLVSSLELSHLPEESLILKYM